MNTLKLAIIGAGYMAEEHIKAFNDIGSIHICGIFSRTKSKSKKLAEKYKISKVYESISLMYEGSRPELVVVAVSEISLSLICHEIFKFSWRVLIEKPLGYNYQNALDIFEISRRYNKKFIYAAFNRRHYSSTRSVQKDLELFSGKRLVSILDQESPKKEEFNEAKEIYSNYMYANSIHLIDYFNIFCRGIITDIKPIIKWNPEEPLYVSSFLEYSSGDIGIYQANWFSPGPWSVSVTTPNRRWEMRPLETASFQSINSRKKEDFKIHKWDKLFKPGLRYQAEEFVKSFYGISNSLPTIEMSLKSMELVKSIYEN